MKLRKISCLFFIIWVISFGLFNHLIANEKNKSNIEKINDLVKSAEDSAEKSNLVNVKVDTELEYFIIDKTGDVLASNYSEINDIVQLFSYDQLINYGINKEMVMVDLVVHDEIEGKVFIKNSYNKVEKTKERLQKILLAVYITVLLLFCLGCLLLYFNYVRPFVFLKNFATRVAQGDLDVPINLNKANPFGAFTKSFDIMRLEIKRARKKEYDANVSKKEVLAELSHDIKTPIASIKAISELEILKTKEDKEINEKFTIIFEKSVQVEKLVNDMLHSSLEELEKLQVNVQQNQSTVIPKFFENNNYNKNITEINTCPDCMVYFDDLRLSQIVDNIIGNSNKYAKTNIVVSYILMDEYLQVNIKDFGNGVPEEEIPLIFNKYYRSKKNNNIEGAGLGLYLAKYLVEKMDGSIEASNESDGFVVSILLRLC